MRITVIGGDGYLGWPMAIHLSRAGHEVLIVDNFARRRADEELGSDTLVPILALSERVALWKKVSGRIVHFLDADLTRPETADRFMADFRPDAVIHFGEQRSAPYSMIDQEHAVYTQVNNVAGTLNLIYSIARHNPDCHLVKLGTMGEYGTPNIDIEEGYLEITHNGRKDTLLYPKQPGSIYHLTKVHDSYNIHFACRIWGLRATDLNQGVVYGVETEETAMDEGLSTRLDYDGVWGTALNRFCVQSVIGHPISVYGQGGQTRGFLDIRDTLQCIDLALKNPPARGVMQVFNQFTEQFNVLELAFTVQKAALALGIEAVVQHIPNPRIEKEAHYYNAKNTKLVDLGLRPHALSETLLTSVFGKVKKYIHRVKTETILPRVFWKDTKTGQLETAARFVKTATPDAAGFLPK